MKAVERLSWLQLHPCLRGFLDSLFSFQESFLTRPAGWKHGAPRNYFANVHLNRKERPNHHGHPQPS